MFIETGCEIQFKIAQLQDLQVFSSAAIFSRQIETKRFLCFDDKRLKSATGLTSSQQQN